MNHDHDAIILHNSSLTHAWLSTYESISSLTKLRVRSSHPFHALLSPFRTCGHLHRKCLRELGGCSAVHQVTFDHAIESIFRL